MGREDGDVNRLDAIRKRLNEATPGPWKAMHRHAGCTTNDDETSGLGLEVVGPPEAWGRGQFARAADAQLIAHAPEDLRLLLTVAEAAAAARNHARFGADGSECSTEYVCDGDCDVAIALWERFDEELQKLTEEEG